MSVRISSRLDGDTTVVTVDDVGVPADRMRLRRDLMLHAGRGSGPLVVDLRRLSDAEQSVGAGSVLDDVTAHAARAGRHVDVVQLPLQARAVG